MAETNLAEAPIYLQELDSLASDTCGVICYAEAVIALLRPLAGHPSAVAATVIANSVIRLVNTAIDALDEAAHESAAPRETLGNVVGIVKEAEGRLSALQCVLGQAPGYGALSREGLGRAEENLSGEPFCSSVGLVIFFQRELGRILRRLGALIRKMPEPIAHAA